ncbi:MAG: hypothetical protein IJJ28_04325 [Lentisphaeria bacterium]|nr:hypothetical protein [Lentisphaeria bacterium]
MEETNRGSKPFRTSLQAQAAARMVIAAARESGVLDDGALVVDPALAEMEKALFAGMFKAVARRGTPDLTPDEFSSMFHFVFARAAEAATACWSGRPFETGTDGLFDGKTPFYADDALKGYIHAQEFPVRCAQRCWDELAEGNLTGAASGGLDPLLPLFEALKWCFRIGCHASLRFLERRGQK